MIAFTDRHDDAVGELRVGDEFRIHVLVRDTREGEAAAGVPSAFVDIRYDPALIAITDLTHFFDDFASGEVDEPAGVINEAGGLENGSVTGGVWQPLLYLDAVAVQPGLVSISTSRGDSQFSENTLFGIDEDLRDATRYGQAEIEIAPTPSSTTDNGDADNVSFDLPLNSNWNLISIPIALSEAGMQMVLDQARSGIAWAWNGEALERLALLQPGRGYWLFIDGEPRTLTITGKPVTDDVVTLNDGWNLIGSIAHPPYAATSLPLDPQKFIGSENLKKPILTWDGSAYIESDHLVPGAGYFIFTSDPPESE